MARLRREVRDLWQLVLAPGLPALLPWRWGFALYRLLSRAQTIFRVPVEVSLRAAMDQMPEQDEHALRRRLRFVRILDAADLYLARRTPVDWAPGGHFRREGEWPEKGPFMAISCHHGTGMWMLRDLQRAGHRTVVIAAPFDKSMFAGRLVEVNYATWRWKEMERSAGTPSAFRPKIRPKLVSALEQGKVVMGLLDIPPQLVPSRQLPVTLLGRPACLPAGMLDLAHAVDVPIVPYWVEIDDRGHRVLHIEPARKVEDPEAELQWFAGHLDRLLRKDPGAWHFWPEWPQWLAHAATLRAAHPETVATRAVEPPQPQQGTEHYTP